MGSATGNRDCFKLDGTLMSGSDSGVYVGTLDDIRWRCAQPEWPGCTVVYSHNCNDDPEDAAWRGCATVARGSGGSSCGFELALSPSPPPAPPPAPPPYSQLTACFAAGADNTMVDNAAQASFATLVAAVDACTAASTCAAVIDHTTASDATRFRWHASGSTFTLAHMVYYARTSSSGGCDTSGRRRLAKARAWLPADLEEDHEPVHAGAWAHWPTQDDLETDHYAPHAQEGVENRETRI